jgi:hypothetical protein
MPSVINAVYANQKQPFEKIISVFGLRIEAWNVSLHDFTASALA